MIKVPKSVVDVDSLVCSADVILKEYKNVSSSSDLWVDWPSDFYHDADWQVMPVFLSTDWIKKNPFDSASWEELMAPLSVIWGNTIRTIFGHCNAESVSVASFSRLRAGSELKPHRHDNDGHLIFHMGIEIPEGDVGIQTSSGTHKWNKPKDWLVFDDTKTHSAWNHTDQDRVIFYLDFVY